MTNNFCLILVTKQAPYFLNNKNQKENCLIYEGPVLEVHNYIRTETIASGIKTKQKNYPDYIRRKNREKQNENNLIF